MKAFANLFLVLFLADGAFPSSTNSCPFSRSAPFSGTRTVRPTCCHPRRLSIYLCLGIDRRLPKRVFLPLILFVLLLPLVHLAFPGSRRYRAYGLLAAAAQVVFGLLSSHGSGKEVDALCPSLGNVAARRGSTSRTPWSSAWQTCSSSLSPWCCSSFSLPTAIWPTVRRLDAHRARRALHGRADLSARPPDDPAYGDDPCGGQEYYDELAGIYRPGGGSLSWPKG